MLTVFSVILVYQYKFWAVAPVSMISLVFIYALALTIEFHLEIRQKMFWQISTNLSSIHIYIYIYILYFSSLLHSFYT
jgi:hypothetical protein